MKIPKYFLPLIVLIALVGGYFLRTAFTQPTTNVVVGSGEGMTLDCIVDGVKCRGTAEFFTSLYKDKLGIKRIETFASDHRVVFTFDPELITPMRIRNIMEAQIPLEDGTTVQAFKCVSME